MSVVSYKILLLSVSVFFKLFFHIFTTVIEAQVFVYPPHRMQLPAMLATSALHLSTQVTADNVIKSLKSEESAGTDHKL